MTTYKLSPHTLNLYAGCQRCFWEDQHGVKRPSGPFPSLPSGMDKIIKQRFDEYRKRGEMPEELCTLEGVELLPEEELRSLVGMTLWNHEKLKEWQNQRKGLKWATEKGHILWGAVDDVLQTTAESLVALDYKTRGFPLKQAPDYYTLQLECYTLLMQKNDFQTTDYAFLLFYYPDQFTEKGEVKFHHQLLKVGVDPEHAEETFTGAVSLLQGRKPRLNKDCQFCEYRGRK